jgi:hypothetical protein
MQVTSFVVSLLLLASWASGQVLPPEEIRDQNLRELQKKYWAELKQIPAAASKHDFPYRFYFSRTLDLSEKQQQSSDQRSVQFDRYHDQTVLKITGNYFASYSAELMKPDARVRQTYQEVMLPLLEAAVPPFVSAEVPEAFAFEISHHVRRKILGVSSEIFENVVLILPKASAVRLVAAAGPQAKQAALAEGEMFLNAEPIEPWPGSRSHVTQAALAPAPAARSNPPAPSTLKVAKIDPASLRNPPQPSNPVAPPAPEHDGSPDALKNIQNSYQATLDRMTQELNSQAHFVRYAPPAFIPFHNGLYLQLSVTTTLPESAAGSQYRLAALAFDRHIAHLIRPTIEYFKEGHADFDGIDFSASVRLGAAENLDGSPVAVEFIFSLRMLQSYKQFDVTGQQLIDSGFVLINGERVGLDLQIAEAGGPAK